MSEAREDQERLLEHDVDLANIGPAWMRLTQGGNVMEGPASMGMSK